MGRGGERVSMKKLLLIGLVVLLAFAGLSVLVAALRTPSHDGDWKPEHARLPRAAIDGDRARIENLRDFAFAPDGTLGEARYHDRDYDISGLESLWYGISHFTSYGLAHTFLSFGFADGRYVTFSYEARQETDQSYSPILGLFGAYNLILIVSEERDVIGRRTHIWGQEVYLYEIQADPGKIRQLFEALLEQVNELREQPAFYHTITDNCTVSLWRFSRRLSPFELYTHPKLLLPGHSDEVAYDLDLIANDLPFDDMRAAARINPAGYTPDDPDFSRRLRGLSHH